MTTAPIVSAPQSVHPSAERALTKAEWQPTLFAETLSRRALRRLAPSWDTAPLRLRVHRNHAFEGVASVLDPFLAVWDRRADVRLGDYDDSLSFSEAGDADIELLWLDYGRYQLAGAELAGWLAERLTVLRARTDAPIAVADHALHDENAEAFRAGLSRALPAGVTLLPVGEIARRLGDRFFDRRASALSGTPLSNAALLETARELGLRWLPPLVAPRVKAVFVDLDHTLYEGVLGEDGVQGVRLTAAHRGLQKDLLALHEQGVFLGVISRNEEADAEALFATRADFPLRREHFSTFQVSWGSKGEAILRGADALRIAPDAVLFVDDNPGELAAVGARVPSVHTLHAATGETTRAGLAAFPCLHGYRASGADRVRARDLAANEARDALRRSAVDPTSYLRSLAVELTFAVDDRAQAERVHALSHKTNQFNTAFGRKSEAEVARYFDDDDRRVVTVALSDRLSNSGVVGMMLLRRAGDALVVDDLCVSCRALGRGVDRPLIFEPLRVLAEETGAGAVRFPFVEGPRNGPAKRFLEAEVGPIADGAADVAPEGLVSSDLPVTLTWRRA